MKTVAIIQARVGSTRLPGKTLIKLGEQTVLERVLRRVDRCQSVDQVVVATTRKPEDDAICDEVLRHGFDFFRGSEADVLSRYHAAAENFDAEVVVRVTSDCPFIDPQLIDVMLDQYFDQRQGTLPLDYLSNANPRTYPHGLDTEIFTALALAEAHRNATQPFEREHVTSYLYLRQNRYRIGHHHGCHDLSHHRWTLDEPSDLQFFKAIVDRLPDPFVTTDEVLALLAKYPELATINSHVVHKSLRSA